jgi:tripartite-type tricarboxylate transporter receptor subunit TctC
MPPEPGRSRRLSRRAVAALSALALGTAAASPVSAEDYPARPIRVVSGPPTGASGVVAARLVAAKMSAALGQPVVIENRPGASGTIAAAHVKAQPPDGHTLLFASAGTAVTARFLMKDATLDMTREFTPISLFVEVPSFLVVHSSVPVDSVQGLIDYAKRNPGKLAFGSVGVGSTFHLIGESLKLSTGIDMLHVPYAGANVSTVVTDLVNGRIQVYFPSMTVIGPHVGSGNVKLLAVLDKERFKRLPDLPTVNETLPDNKHIPAWFAFFGPPGLPPPIVARLQAEIHRGVHDPEVVARLDTMGIVPIGGTPDDLTAEIRRNTDDVAALVKALGIQPN